MRSMHMTAKLLSVVFFTCKLIAQEDLKLLRSIPIPFSKFQDSKIVAVETDRRQETLLVASENLKHSEIVVFDSNLQPIRKLMLTYKLAALAIDEPKSGS